MIGAMWGDDECSFADVTMVVGRLHHIVKSFHDQQPQRLCAADSPRILLAPAPGEQHVFALDLVEAFFRDGGWRAEIAHTDNADDIIERVATEPFDAVGFTLSRVEAVDVLRATILRLRAHALHKDVLVLVGGPVFDADPRLAALVGADDMAEPGVAGAVIARKLLPART
jgi:methanogenic corrinoid protein MtbC1